MGLLDVTVAVATIVLALMAIVTAGASYFLLRANTDPHVIVYAHHARRRPTMIEIVIENIGQGVAYEVTFNLDRPIPAYAPGINPTGPKEVSEPMTEGPLAEGIPALAPGEKRVLNWGQYGGIRDQIGDKPVRVLATFSGRRNHAWDPSAHTVESLLEVRSFWNTDASATEGREQIRELQKMGKDLHKLADAIAGPIGRQLIEEQIRKRELLVAEGDDEGTS